MYDHVADTWRKIPNMISRRNFRKSIAVKTKLTVVKCATKNVVKYLIQ